ncbi:hypothetical protein ACFQYP_21645 [Nonomuraea antimicrobica]
MVLSLGWGEDAVEVSIQEALSDLVEVHDPAVQASEMSVGLFYQYGHTYTATQSGNASVSADVDTRALIPALPEGWRELAQVVGVGTGFTAGRSASASGGAKDTTDGGSVADNRSESMLFEAKAVWSVSVRTRQDSGWGATTRVDSGTPSDPGVQRIWVWHSYVDQTPGREETIPRDLRDPKMPNVEPISMAGMEAALKALETHLGGDFARIGTNAHSDLRTFVTQTISMRLRDAAEGLSVPLLVKGVPYATIKVKSEIVLEESEREGAPTAEALEEEVLTQSTASPSRTEYGGSLEGRVSGGPVLENPDVLGPVGEYHPDRVTPVGKVGRPVAQSSASTANEASHHVEVDKRNGRSQAYRAVVRHTFTVERLGKPRRAAADEGHGPDPHAGVGRLPLRPARGRGGGGHGERPAEDRRRRQRGDARQPPEGAAPGPQGRAAGVARRRRRAVARRRGAPTSGASPGWTGSARRSWPSWPIWGSWRRSRTARASTTPTGSCAPLRCSPRWTSPPTSPRPRCVAASTRRRRTACSSPWSSTASTPSPWCTRCTSCCGRTSTTWGTRG